MGGTQRLTRAIGYYKAAELVLTGRIIDADEAERIGLVSRVTAAGELLEEASRTAEMIASKSLPSVYATKEALGTALESSLAEGLRFERQSFSMLFHTEDQKEGMAAFREKRTPAFRHR
jgi:enoyl-CoA hydratase